MISWIISNYFYKCLDIKDTVDLQSKNGRYWIMAYYPNLEENSKKKYYARNFNSMGLNFIVISSVQPDNSYGIEGIHNRWICKE